MKTNKLIISLVLISLAVSCKKKHNCYVQDANNMNIDTIKCQCSEETIKELESSPYIKKDTTYKISCQKL